MSTRKKFDEYRGYVLVQHQKSPYSYSIFEANTGKEVMHTYSSNGIITQEKANEYIDLFIRLLKELEKGMVE